MKMIAAQSSSAILEKKIFFVKSTAFYTQFIFQRDFLRENDDGNTKTFFSPSRFFFREINHFFESNLFPNYTFLCENDCKTFFS